MLQCCDRDQATSEMYLDIHKEISLRGDKKLVAFAALRIQSVEKIVHRETKIKGTEPQDRPKRAVNRRGNLRDYS